MFSTLLYFPLIVGCLSTPVKQATFSGGPPPGIYGSNVTKSGPVTPGNTTFPTGTSNGTAVDVLFQNLLAAEWIVEDLYAQGVAFFNQSDFDALGLPNSTLPLFTEILQNEGGHLKIFEAAISDNVTKPGRCQYDYQFQRAPNRTAAAALYISIVSEVELGSMAFLTGLAQTARSSPSGLAIIAGVISVESRHLTWINYAALGSDPFVGPSDTTYPWAVQILSETKQFIIEGTCPSNNPPFPIGDQFLPKFSLLPSSSVIPNGFLDVAFGNQSHGDHNPPTFVKGEEIIFNYFHSLWNYSTSVTITNTSTIRAPLPNLTSFSGQLIVAMSKTAPLVNQEDVIAGPLLIELDFPLFAEL